MASESPTREADGAGHGAEEYLLLLHEEPDIFESLSPEEFQRAIERYRAWTEELQRDGSFLASDKLTDGEGRVLRKEERELRVTDGPYAETKEVIGGYYAVRAGSYEEAVALARGCPHLDYGGTIEIRQVERFGPPEGG